MTNDAPQSAKHKRRRFVCFCGRSFLRRQDLKTHITLAFRHYGTLEAAERALGRKEHGGNGLGIITGRVAASGGAPQP